METNHIVSYDPFTGDRVLRAPVGGRDAIAALAAVVAINPRGDAVELEAPFGGRKRTGHGAADVDV